MFKGIFEGNWGWFGGGNVPPPKPSSEDEPERSSIWNNTETFYSFVTNLSTVYNPLNLINLQKTLRRDSEKELKIISENLPEKSKTRLWAGYRLLPFLGYDFFAKNNRGQLDYWNKFLGDVSSMLLEAPDDKFEPAVFDSFEKVLQSVYKRNLPVSEIRRMIKIYFDPNAQDSDVLFSEEKRPLLALDDSSLSNDDINGLLSRYEENIYFARMTMITSSSSDCAQVSAEMDAINQELDSSSSDELTASEAGLLESDEILTEDGRVISRADAEKENSEAAAVQEYVETYNKDQRQAFRRGLYQFKPAKIQDLKSFAEAYRVAFGVKNSTELAGKLQSLELHDEMKARYLRRYNRVDKGVRLLKRIIVDICKFDLLNDKEIESMAPMAEAILDAYESNIVLLSDYDDRLANIFMATHKILNSAIKYKQAQEPHRKDYLIDLAKALAKLQTFQLTSFEANLQGKTYGATDDKSRNGLRLKKIMDLIESTEDL